MALEGPAAAALGELSRERWREAGGRALLASRRSLPDRTSRALARGPDAAFPRRVGRDQPLAPGDGGRSGRSSRSRRPSSPRSPPRAATSSPRASTSPRAASPRRWPTGWPSPTGPKSCWSPPSAPMAGSSRSPWTPPAPAWSRCMRHADAHRRFRLYHPVTAAGRPIYVHAKVLIVDDRVLHVGSSNMNNRSLRLDTECDVMIDAASAANADDAGAIGAAIAGLRDRLLGEHLGLAPASVRRAGRGRGLADRRDRGAARRGPVAAPLPGAGAERGRDLAGRQRAARSRGAGGDLQAAVAARPAAPPAPPLPPPAAAAWPRCSRSASRRPNGWVRRRRPVRS